MLPRECDNDDCDYDTFVDGNGRAQAQWIHVNGCEGPVPFDELAVKNTRPGSFLAYLLNRE